MESLLATYIIITWQPKYSEVFFLKILKQLRAFSNSLLFVIEIILN